MREREEEEEEEGKEDEREKHRKIKYTANSELLITTTIDIKKN